MLLDPQLGRSQLLAVDAGPIQRHLKPGLVLHDGDGCYRPLPRSRRCLSRIAGNRAFGIIRYEAAIPHVTESGNIFRGCAHLFRLLLSGMHSMLAAAGEGRMLPPETVPGRGIEDLAGRQRGWQMRGTRGLS